MKAERLGVELFGLVFERIVILIFLERTVASPVPMGESFASNRGNLLRLLLLFWLLYLGFFILVFASEALLS